MRPWADATVGRIPYGGAEGEIHTDPAEVQDGVDSVAVHAYLAYGAWVPDLK